MIVYNDLDGLIAEAMKAKNNERLAALRLIKAKFMEYTTSKGAKPIDDSIEIQVLRKMIHEREDSIHMYLEGGREDLAKKEQYEISVIEEFLPEEVTEAQVEEAFRNVCATGLSVEKKNMGLFIKKIKEALPLADGKLVSTVVLKKLNG